MDRLNPSLVRQFFVLALILFLLVLIFKEITPYLSGILGAITLFVLLKKPMFQLTKRGWKPIIAVSFLMFLSFIAIHEFLRGWRDNREGHRQFRKGDRRGKTSDKRS